MAEATEVSDDKIELLVRRILDEEVGGYRTSLQSQFRLTIGSITTVFVAAAALAAYLFGHNVTDLVEGTVSRRVADYKLDEDLQVRLTLYLQKEVESAENRISDVVKSATNEELANARLSLRQIVENDITRQTAQIVDGAVRARIDREVERLGGEGIEEIITRSTTPTGVVTASTLECKDLGDGWSPYEPADGRFLLGVGKGPLEQAISLETSGGIEKNTLTEEEIPSHGHEVTWYNQHTISLNQQPPSVPIRNPADNRYRLPATGDGREGDNMTTTQYGLGKPFTNMPPFVALYFCEYEGTG